MTAVSGSGTTEIENSMTSHVLYLNYNTLLNDHLELDFNVMWTKADMAHDELVNWAGPIHDIHHLDFEGFSETHTYSDLDDRMLEADLGLNMLISDRFTMYGEIGYREFDDRAPYVYGDMTGDWTYGKVVARIHY